MTDPAEDSRNAELERLRVSIDELDRVLVKLLNQRAKYALEIGRVKREIFVPIYSPEREREVLEHVERQNLGPLSVEGLRRLYERIIDESRRLEREGGESKKEDESC